MKYYNVYLYNSCPVELNVEQYSNEFIWKIELTTQDTPTPEGATVMSSNEIMQYRETNRDIFNTWTSAKVTQETKSDKKVKMAIKSMKSLIRHLSVDKSRIIANALKDVIFYAENGNIQECYNEFNSLEITQSMSPYLTETIKQTTCNQILEIINTL